MKSQSKQQPERIAYIGRMQHHINFGLSTSTAEDGSIDYNYETALINGDATHDMIVRSVIADKYTTDDEIALINNFNTDKEVEEYVQYQQLRELAKFIADSETLLTAEEVEAQIEILKRIKITIPLAKVVEGGIYAGLADMLLKTRVIHTTAGANVIVYLSHLLPEHRAILEADPDVTIE